MLLAATLLSACAILHLASEAIAAAAFPGYSYITHYVSDLGVPYRHMFYGSQVISERAWIMNLGGLVVPGLLFASAACVIVSTVRPTGAAGVAILAFAGLHALGSLLAGMVHAGPRELESGAIVLHMIGASTAISAGSAVAIVAASLSRRIGAPRSYQVASLFLGLLGCSSLAGSLVVTGFGTTASIGNAAVPIGLLERGATYSITLVAAMTSVALFKAAREARSRTSSFNRPAEE